MGQTNVVNEQLLQEVQEVNLAYLVLAQHMIRADKAQARYRLGELSGHDDVGVQAGDRGTRCKLGARMAGQQLSLIHI